MRSPGALYHEEEKKELKEQQRKWASWVGGKARLCVKSSGRSGVLPQFHGCQKKTQISWIGDKGEFTTHSYVNCGAQCKMKAKSPLFKRQE